MRVQTSYTDILKLAAPISLSILIPQINFSTNNYFLGRVGEQELAVNGIAGVTYLVLLCIGMGLGNGVQIQMARRAGEEDDTGIAAIFANSMLLSLVLSSVLLALTLVAAPLLFSGFVHHRPTALLSTQFIRIRSWGLPFIMLTQVANAFYIASGKAKYLIYISLASTGLNILFDYLLIGGHQGFPAMGIRGAAVASVIAEAGGFLMAYSLFLFNRLGRRFPVGAHLHIDLPLSARSLRVSAPLIVQFCFSIGGWLIFYFFIEHLGTRALAASNLLRAVFGIVGVGCFAFASATNTMVSNIIAQDRAGEVFPLLRRILLLSLSFAVCISVLLLSFPEAFLSFYRPDPELIAYTVASLRVIAVSVLMMSVSTILFNAVVGSGNTLVNLLMEIACVGVYLVYCYTFIERMRLPLYVAWGSEFVYWTSLGVLSALYLRSGKWKGKII